jgi:hypothetical protein
MTARGVAHLAERDRGVGDAEREAWQQRQPEAGSHERLGDQDVVGFVRDLG